MKEYIVTTEQGANQQFHELIRCKDCKWWTKQTDSIQGRCALFGIYPTGAWYCANARREDHETD